MALCLGACVSPPAKLQLAEAPLLKDPRSTAEITRQINLRPAFDTRPEGEALGRVGGRSFSSGDVKTWINNAVKETLLHEGFALAPDAGISLEPRVLKAYVDSVDIAKTAVVVIEVRYRRQDGAEVARTYRGQHAGVNWVSGEGEVTASLQKAIQRCLRAFVVDVRQLSVPGAETAWRE